MYQSSLLERINGVVHGFGSAGVELSEYVNGAKFPRTHQVHGNVVHVLDGNCGDDVLNGDAFITDEPGIACFVRTADCVPILVADPVSGAVGAIHAGWRGTAVDVVGAAVGELHTRFGADPSDVRAAIGPAICGLCYEVGEDVIAGMHAAGLENERGIFIGSSHVNLRAANRALLVRAGIRPRNIDILDTCTSCGQADLASYRRDKSEVRQYSYIMLNG